MSNETQNEQADGKDIMAEALAATDAIEKELEGKWERRARLEEERTLVAIRCDTSAAEGNERQNRDYDERRAEEKARHEAFMADAGRLAECREKSLAIDERQAAALERIAAALEGKRSTPVATKAPDAPCAWPGCPARATGKAEGDPVCATHLTEVQRACGHDFNDFVTKPEGGAP